MPKTVDWTKFKPGDSPFKTKEELTEFIYIEMYYFYAQCGDSDFHLKKFMEEIKQNDELRKVANIVDYIPFIKDIARKKAKDLGDDDDDEQPSNSWILFKMSAMFH